MSYESSTAAKKKKPQDLQDSGDEPGRIPSHSQESGARTDRAPSYAQESSGSRLMGTPQDTSDDSDRPRRKQP